MGCDSLDDSSVSMMGSGSSEVSAGESFEASGWSSLSSWDFGVSLEASSLGVGFFSDCSVGDSVSDGSLSATSLVGVSSGFSFGKSFVALFAMFSARFSSWSFMLFPCLDVIS